MKRGEIYWLSLSGQKRRPAVILSPFFLNEVRDRVLSAPCTSRRTDEIALTEVLLDKHSLKKVTKIQCQDMGTFRKQFFGDSIRMLTPHEMETLNRAVAISTGLAQL